MMSVKPSSAAAASVEAALAAIVGKANVKTDAAARAQASSSWSPVLAKEKQSYPGEPPRLVQAVVMPANAAEVAAIVRWANETRTPLIPVGGASNTVGNNDPAFPGSVAVDLLRFQELRWDEDSLLVTAGAGWSLGALEERLGEHGYTLGHLPHSLNLATVGGSIATNAIGLLSGKYGRQSDLTLGLEAVLPTGEVWLCAPLPGGASAGSDLRALFFGSEGTLGIITGATMRMRPVPDVRAWAVFTFTDFASGIEAVRLIHRTDARPACVRLFDAGGASAILARHGLPPQGEAASLLLLGFEGDEIVQTGPYQMAYAVCRKVGGGEQPPEIGETWFDERHGQRAWFGANGRPGGIADALAVSASWSSLPGVHAALRDALAPLTTRWEAHLGHAYTTGGALDIAFEGQAASDEPDAALSLYQRIVSAGLDACVEAGGFLAHHYGVGRTHREHLRRAGGETETRMRAAIKAALDPNNLLNPRQGEGADTVTAAARDRGGGGA